MRRYTCLENINNGERVYSGLLQTPIGAQVIEKANMLGSEIV